MVVWTLWLVAECYLARCRSFFLKRFSNCMHIPALQAPLLRILLYVFCSKFFLCFLFLYSVCIWHTVCITISFQKFISCSTWRLQKCLAHIIHDVPSSLWHVFSFFFFQQFWVADAGLTSVMIMLGVKWATRDWELMCCRSFGTEPV